MDSTKLKLFMDSIPIGEYWYIKNQIIVRCKITPQILKNWRNGRTSIPELAKPIIEEIAGAKIFMDKN
jgi:hypothetical protein